MSRKRRFIWTPDELSEMAEVCYQAVFGGKEPVEVEKDKAEKRPVPALLPKPVRPTPGPKGESITVTQLRKAQRAERKRQKFNRKVKKAVTVMAKALQKALKAQAQSAIKVEKACNSGYRAQTEAANARAKAQAKAALAMMRKAKAAVEEFRKRLQAAREWLRAERHRQRRLDQESRVRIAKAIAWGIIPDWHGDFED